MATYLLPECTSSGLCRFEAVTGLQCPAQFSAAWVRSRVVGNGHDDGGGGDNHGAASADRDGGGDGDICCVESMTHNIL